MRLVAASHFLGIAFLALGSAAAEAAREISLFPIAVTSLTSPGTVPGYFGWNLIIRCVNLSSTDTQSLGAELLETDSSRMQVAAKGFVPPGGWTRAPGNPGLNHWWFKAGVPASVLTPKSLVLAPGASGSMSFGYNELTGRDLAGAPNNLAAWHHCYSSCGSEAQAYTGAAVVFAGRLKLRVAEDRGAVLCSTTLSTGGYGWGSAGEGTEEETYEVNGGRPF